MAKLKGRKLVAVKSHVRKPPRRKANLTTARQKTLEGMYREMRGQ